MRWTALFAIPLLLTLRARADERSEQVAEQKEKAKNYLTKAEVAKPVIVETADLLVTGALPEARLKAMGEMLQKQYAAAFKALKFENTDNPPKGKLAVYFFPERKQYTLFVAEVQNERVDKDERSHQDARGNQPYVAVTVLPGEKPTDLDTEAGAQVAVALLQCKAGPAILPGWMKDGFAKSVHWRSDTRVANTDRANVRKLAYETKGKPAKYKAADVWAPGADAEKRLLGASLMDYFVFGPGAPALPKILGGLREEDNGAKPSFDTALKAADLTPDALDKAWKKWVTTGK